ncbi:hypothetical protein [Dapis sp. BLCC M229]|uniref:hypothetical protein n=1 Tax=Dapis sp. BLCC M229 TaxID=3400188 RepID=UPI003CF815F1
MASNLEFYAVKKLRILPRNRCFYWEFVYKKEVVVKPQLNKENVLGINHTNISPDTNFIEGEKN